MTDKEINLILKNAHSLYSKAMNILQDGNRLILDGMYKFPNDISLKLALAAHLSTTGNLTDAIEIYEIVLRTDPNNIFALTGLAMTQFEKGDISLSFRLANRSLKIKKTSETFHLLFRHALRNRNLITAQKLLDEAEILDPSNLQTQELKKRLIHIKNNDGMPNDDL